MGKVHAHFRVFLRQIHGGLQETELAAAVVAGALVAVGKDLFTAQQGCDGICELDFAASAGLDVGYFIKDTGLTALVGAPFFLYLLSGRGEKV